MRRLADVLKDLPDFVHLDGASDEAIVEAERALDVVFAADYREYLSSYGAASANGHELTGICGSPRLDVVAVTSFERERGYCGDPGCYVVEQVGIDGLTAWQSADGRVYLAAPDITPRVVADSLLEYLEG